MAMYIAAILLQRTWLPQQIWELRIAEGFDERSAHDLYIERKSFKILIGLPRVYWEQGIEKEKRDRDSRGIERLKGCVALVGFLAMYRLCTVL